MKRNKLVGAAAVVAAAALVFSSTPIAQAAWVPASKANVGDDCIRAGATAPGRGVDGSALTCMVVQTGTLKGKTKWWYADVKPIKSLEWVASSGVGGGYGTTAIAFADAMKAEGMLTDYTVSYKSGGSGTVGLGYFQDQKNRSDVVFINGFAMVAGVATTKSKLKLSDNTQISGLMREWEAIVVPTSSKYKTITQLLDDVKANPKAMPIAGGSKGTVDHVFMGLLVEQAGVKATDMNYVPYAGGGEVTTSVLSKQTVAGVSGTAEFAPYVKAGKLRVLAISSAKPLATMKGKTLIQQGINMTFGNWRGFDAPGDMSAADRLNFVKVADIVRAGDAWKKTLKDKDWTNLTERGNDFKGFISDQTKSISTLLVSLGLA